MLTWRNVIWTECEAKIKVHDKTGEKYGGGEEIMLSSEIDIIITVRGRAVCCAEVKMRAKKSGFRFA